jgi:hypothetical protein
VSVRRSREPCRRRRALRPEIIRRGETEALREPFGRQPCRPARIPLGQIPFYCPDVRAASSYPLQRGPWAKRVSPRNDSALSIAVVPERRRHGHLIFLPTQVGWLEHSPRARQVGAEQSRAWDGPGRKDPRRVWPSTARVIRSPAGGGAVNPSGTPSTDSSASTPYPRRQRHVPTGIPPRLWPRPRFGQGLWAVGLPRGDPRQLIFPGPLREDDEHPKDHSGCVHFAGRAGSVASRETSAPTIPVHPEPVRVAVDRKAGRTILGHHLPRRAHACTPALVAGAGPAFFPGTPLGIARVWWGRRTAQSVPVSRAPGSVPAHASYGASDRSGSASTIGSAKVRGCAPGSAARTVGGILCRSRVRPSGSGVGPLSKGTGVPPVFSTPPRTHVHSVKSG